MDPIGSGSLYSTDRIEFPSTTTLTFVTVYNDYSFLYLYGKFYDGTNYIGGAIHLNKDSFSFVEMIFMDTAAAEADVYYPTIVGIRDD
jgi:hypothetical protein